MVNPPTIVIWSPFGRNTTELSYQLAQDISKHVRVLLAELPCLGIPRLSFIAGTLERDKSIDCEIVDWEKKKDISLRSVYTVSNHLGVLPADVFSLPDYPVTHRVKLETLISFPVQLINKAYSTGYSLVVLECQGQLTTPMTFNSVKIAGKILIPIQDTGEAAYALINIKRLITIFKIDARRFVLLSKHNPADLTELATIRDEDGIDRCTLSVWAMSNQEIIKHLREDKLLSDEFFPEERKNMRAIISRLLGRCRPVKKTTMKINQEKCKNDLPIKIRL